MTLKVMHDFEGNIKCTVSQALRTWVLSFLTHT